MDGLNLLFVLAFERKSMVPKTTIKPQKTTIKPQKTTIKPLKPLTLFLFSRSFLNFVSRHEYLVINEFKGTQKDLIAL